MSGEGHDRGLPKGLELGQDILHLKPQTKVKRKGEIAIATENVIPVRTAPTATHTVPVRTKLESTAATTNILVKKVVETVGEKILMDVKKTIPVIASLDIPRAIIALDINWPVLI